MRQLMIRLSEEPGLTLYRQIKAAFTLKGMNFTEGCESVGVKRDSARRALCGLWNGPKAEELRLKLYVTAGFTDKED